MTELPDRTHRARITNGATKVGIVGIAAGLLLGVSAVASAEPTAPPASPTPSAQTPAAETAVPGFDSPRALLDALGKKDETIYTLQGEVRFTTIQLLEGDLQTRHGWLYLRTDHGTADRQYAVHFDELIVDQRLEEIDEQYAFDGQWFVERLPADKQFNKRQVVPDGETLDPMELMREAPFWVSLGSDSDRVLSSYEAELLPASDSLVGNEDFPELEGLAALVEGCVQLKLTPKPGSGYEDDWDHVRIWVNASTMLPRLYIKTEWTGNLQIVELFQVKTNENIDGQVFDTQTPGERSGWNVQITPWRGQAEPDTTNTPPAPEPTPAPDEIDG